MRYRGVNKPIAAGGKSKNGQMKMGQCCGDRKVVLKGDSKTEHPRHHGVGGTKRDHLKKE